MQTVLVEKITNLINRALMLDEKNFKSLIKLANKKIAFDIVGLNVKIILSITKEGLIRCKPDDELVDVTIKASVTTFLGIILSRENSRAASAGAIEISGDVELVQEFLSILKTLDIDWEELASQWIGDLPAHKLGNMFRTTRIVSD
jgi:ubiquinone biosynthesis protein UbiJ